MLATLQRGGFGALGADAYRDARIACSASICYGIDGGYTHKWLMDVQTEINRVGKYIFLGAWTPIPVDGFIGQDTFKAAQKVFPFIPKIVQLGRCCPTSYVELAKWVTHEGAIYDALFEFGREPGAQLPPVQAYPTPSPTRPSPVSVTPVSTTAPKRKGRGVALFVLGGLAVVGLVGAGIYYQRRA